MRYTALDRVATRRRTYEFLNPETGRIEFYRFEPGVALQVPQAFALLLARSPDFLVADASGKQIRIIDPPADADLYQPTPDERREIAKVLGQMAVLTDKIAHLLPVEDRDGQQLRALASRMVAGLEDQRS